MSLWLRYHKPPDEPKIVEFEEMTKDQVVKFLSTVTKRLGLKDDDEPKHVVDERIKRLTPLYRKYHQ